MYQCFRDLINTKQCILSNFSFYLDKWVGDTCTPTSKKKKKVETINLVKVMYRIIANKIHIITNIFYQIHVYTYTPVIKLKYLDFNYHTLYLVKM